MACGGEDEDRGVGVGRDGDGWWELKAQELSNTGNIGWSVYKTQTWRINGDVSGDVEPARYVLTD